VESVRGNLIYTAFATVVFTGLQYFTGLKEPLPLAITAVLFFGFTYFMLRLVSRLTGVVIGGFGRGRAKKDEARAVTPIEPTTTRPNHVRRRRDRRRRR
jgi:hypothetical protein